MGEYASKEHGKNCYRTLLGDFLDEIDARLGDIFFFFSGFAVAADHMECHMVRKKGHFWPLLKKNKSLVVPGS
jgi:hypothetical protein